MRYNLLILAILFSTIYSHAASYEILLPGTLDNQSNNCGAHWGILLNSRLLNRGLDSNQRTYSGGACYYRIEGLKEDFPEAQSHNIEAYDILFPGEADIANSSCGTHWGIILNGRLLNRGLDSNQRTYSGGACYYRIEDLKEDFPGI